MASPFLLGSERRRETKRKNKKQTKKVVRKEKKKNHQSMASTLNANAVEWRPRDTAVSHDLLEFALPSTTNHVDGAPLSAFLPTPSTGGGRVPSSLNGEEGRSSAAAGNATLPPPYIPSYMAGGNAAIAQQLAEIDWDAECRKLMELTGELITKQLNGEMDGEEPGAAVRRAALGVAANGAGATDQAVLAAKAVAPTAASLTYAGVLRQAQSNAAAAAGLAVGDSASVAGDAGKGKHHWKKLTKAQQRREQSQKGAFEAFASALLHGVSPFMSELRKRCQTSLPHIKVDQRFGKSGQPQTAIAQFIVAPLVTNYRPRHFHDVTPGDLMEYHYDMAQVLRQIKSAYAIQIGYGPTWKRYAVPFCYVACREYQKEVLSLCPHEIPNSRAEAMYEDDIIKDITEVVLAVEGLEQLQRMSFLEAMSRRVNLVPLYDAFDDVFQPLENYQVQIHDLNQAPSRYILKTSRLEVEMKPQPIVLHGDPNMWESCPVVSRVATVLDGDREPSPTIPGNTVKTPPVKLVAVAAPAPAPAADPHHSDSNAGGKKKAPAAKSGSVASPSPTQPTTKGQAPAAATLQGGSGVSSISRQALVPLAVSAACITATLAIVLWKKK